MKILIATDGSRFSEAAIRMACELAGGSEHNCFRIVAAHEPHVPMAVEPFGLSVTNLDRLDQVETAHAERIAEHAVEMIRNTYSSYPVCLTSIVEQGRPAQVIVEEAVNWDADLIVVGSHGHGFWERLTLGSVSDAVVHHAHCSVLVVKVDGRLSSVPGGQE